MLIEIIELCESWIKFLVLILFVFYVVYFIGTMLRGIGDTGLYRCGDGSENTCIAINGHKVWTIKGAKDE